MSRINNKTGIALAAFLLVAIAAVGIPFVSAVEMHSETVNVTDAGNETIVVDTEFTGDSNETATIEVADNETGDVVNTTTVEYVASEHDGNWTSTTEINVSEDGLYDVTVDDSRSDDTTESGIAEVYVSVEDESTTAAAGWVDENRENLGMAALLLGVFGGLYWAVREGHL